MQFPARFADLPEYAFPRLRRLLDGVTPGRARARHDHRRAEAPAAGDRRAAPSPSTPASSRSTRRTTARPELRAAIAGWLARRYGLAIDPETRIIPLNGTREGLFNAAIALSPGDQGRRPPAGPDAQPLLPGLRRRRARRRRASRCRCPPPRRPAFSPTTARCRRRSSTGSRSATSARPPIRRARSPSAGYWRRLMALAERHDFRILADECYAEIYRDSPPPGALEIAAAAGADPERVVIFHSLSKRSNAPGLRSGFAAGGPRAIAALKQLRAYGGAPLPLPLQHASAALWNDEAHVEASRALYRDEVRARRPHRSATCPATPRRRRASFSGCASATARPRRSASGARPACGFCPAATSAAPQPPRRTQARTTSALRWWPTPPGRTRPHCDPRHARTADIRPRRRSDRWQRPARRPNARR